MLAHESTISIWLKKNIEYLQRMRHANRQPNVIWMNSKWFKMSWPSWNYPNLFRRQFGDKLLDCSQIIKTKTHSIVGGTPSIKLYTPNNFFKTKNWLDYTVIINSIQLYGLNACK